MGRGEGRENGSRMGSGRWKGNCESDSIHRAAAVQLHRRNAVSTIVERSMGLGKLRRSEGI